MKLNTCPICARVWEPRSQDNVMLPFCGHYDDCPEGHRPCEECGLAHLSECNPVITWTGDEALAKARGEKE